MRDDLKAAIRSLRASPAFSVAALLVLTLGIGSTTAIFSIVDGVALRPLPFDEPSRLVAIGERVPPGTPASALLPDPAGLRSIAPQNYRDWAARQQAFEAMAAIAAAPMTLQEPGGEPEQIRAARVTAPFFDVLRVRPAAGRMFAAGDEIEGSDRVAVISDALWRGRFGADAAIVGRTIPLEGAAYEVIGIAPPGFTYPVGSRQPHELWVPFVPPPADRIRVPGSSSSYLTALARLRPGASLSEASADMDRIAAGLRQEHPAWNRNSHAGVKPLRDQIVGGHVRSWMLMLLGAVALLLVIACANVANLMLVRASSRAREIGVRAALGAGRRQLVRALAAEGAVLCAAGTLLALVAAFWGVGVLRAAMPDAIPRVGAIALDARAFAGAVTIAAVTTLLSAIVPAVQASRPDLAGILRDGGRSASAGRAGQRARSMLVVVEIAMAVVLVTGAALFIESFRRLMDVDLGYDTSNVLAMSVSPRFPPFAATGPFPDGAAQLEALVERLARVPGVTHASAIAGGTPLTMSRSTSAVVIRGETFDRENSVSIRRVTARYHETMRIPLREGRLFSHGDRTDSMPVLLVNELAVRAYFAGRVPIGDRVTVNAIDRTVVGVVGNVYQNDHDVAPVPEFYIPMSQARTTSADILLRTAADPYSVLAAVRAAALDVIRDVPLRNVRSLDEALARRVAQRRLNMMLVGLFGVLALVISAAGIYGTMAFMVAERRREIGVRLALGATRGQVVGTIMRRAAGLTIAGLATGVMAAWLLSGTARAFLFAVSTADPGVFAGSVGLLALAAAVASLVPATRAAAIDPAISLKPD